VRHMVFLLLLVSLSTRAETFSCSWMDENAKKPTISKVEVTGDTAKVVNANEWVQNGLHSFKVFQNDEEELILVKSPATKRPGETKTAGSSLIIFLIDKINMESAWGDFGTKGGAHLSNGRCMRLGKN
jgi:hypothetical protein